MSGRTIARTLALSATIAGLAACAPQGNGIAGNGLNAGIIGGTDATGNEEFAKTVVLLYEKNLGAMCTASILSDKVLVTAAHCVEGATQLFAIFGTDADATPLVYRQAVVATTTPVWQARSNQDLNTGDMALVGFVGGLPAGYKPAKLLTDLSSLKNGQNVMLAGYGTSDGVAGTGAGKLRYVTTTIQQTDYSDSEVLMEQSHGKGACHGDSGGPAYVQVNGERLLLGVTSRGVNDPQNHCDVSAAYTSVVYYADWIKSKSVLVAAAVDKAVQNAKNSKNNSNASNSAAKAKKPRTNASNGGFAAAI